MLLSPKRFGTREKRKRNNTNVNYIINAKTIFFVTVTRLSLAFQSDLKKKKEEKKFSAIVYQFSNIADESNWNRANRFKRIRVMPLIYSQKYNTPITYIHVCVLKVIYIGLINYFIIFFYTVCTKKVERFIVYGDRK